MSVQPVPIFPTHGFTASAPSASSPPITRYVGLRVGDTERTAVCDTLAGHFAEGRLSPDELDARLAVATAAVTQSDLSGLLVDLPREARPHRSPAYPQPPSSTYSQGSVPRPIAPATGTDVLTWIGVVGALGLILVMMVAIGAFSPVMFVASAFGGMLAVGFGAGVVHLMHRSVDRRRPPV